MHSCIVAHPTIQCLAQAQWPALLILDLKTNQIDATGNSYLLQGSWPVLYYLELSVEGPDHKLELTTCCTYQRGTS